MSSLNIPPLITIRLAEETDVEVIQKCRFDVYSEEGFIDPDNFPDGREFDAYDSHAISIIATAGLGTVAIGTTRLILGSQTVLPIQGFPHSAVINSQSSAGEISRLCVRDKYRNGKVSIGMYRVLFHITQVHEIEEVYIIVDEDFFNTIRWIGFPFEKIGPTRDYMGKTIPAMCAVSEVLPSLKNSENANLLGVTALFERPFPGQLIM